MKDYEKCELCGISYINPDEGCPHCGKIRYEDKEKRYSVHSEGRAYFVLCKLMITEKQIYFLDDQGYGAFGLRHKIDKVMKATLDDEDRCVSLTDICDIVYPLEETMVGIFGGKTDTTIRIMRKCNKKYIDVEVPNISLAKLVCREIEIAWRRCVPTAVRTNREGQAKLADPIKAETMAARPKFCRYCGTRLSEEDVYCSGCGYKI